MIAPFFHIVDRYNYWKHLPYIQSGGPTCLTSIDIYKKGLSNKAFKNFFIKNYVKHPGQGTVSLFDLNAPGKLVLFPDDIKPKDYFKGHKYPHDIYKGKIRLYDFFRDIDMKFSTEEEMLEFYAENYL